MELVNNIASNEAFTSMKIQVVRFVYSDFIYTHILQLLMHLPFDTLLNRCSLCFFCDWSRFTLWEFFKYGPVQFNIQ